MAHPFRRGSSNQKKNTVDPFIGHIPFASLEGDKRPDKINQKSREFEHFNALSRRIMFQFLSTPSDKNHLFICCGIGGSPTYLHMTHF